MEKRRWVGSVTSRVDKHIICKKDKKERKKEEEILQSFLFFFLFVILIRKARAEGKTPVE